MRVFLYNEIDGDCEADSTDTAITSDTLNDNRSRGKMIVHCNTAVNQKMIGISKFILKINLHKIQITYYITFLTQCVLWFNKETCFKLDPFWPNTLTASSLHFKIL
jgi:hypothetical protein